MKTVNTFAGDLRLVGGRLGLDFVNTVNDHALPQPRDHWRDYGLFLIWAQHAGAATPAQLEAAARAAAADPAAAQAALELARHARRALYGVFSANAAGRPFAAADTEALNAALARMPAPALLDASTKPLAWRWPAEASPLEAPIWPALLSAAALLASPELPRVRECAGEGCSWLFLDTSRTGIRRWCSMEDCGNIAKARRYYRRMTNDE
jgi:predicted RNA-binding Zn ribbon-like protein